MSGREPLRPSLIFFIVMKADNLAIRLIPPDHVIGQAETRLNSPIIP
jgi:hypothetical protein